MATIFTDRAHAGSTLATALRPNLRADPVVLALPRGGVTVGRRVAEEIRAPLDVIPVHRLTASKHPTFPIGAIAEDRVSVLDHRAVLWSGVTEVELKEAEEAERADLLHRVEIYRGGRPRLNLEGRHVILVDDGVSTGFSMIVACRAARQLGAAFISVGVGVARPGWTSALLEEAEELLAVATPLTFISIGQWYDNFERISDDEIVLSLMLGYSGAWLSEGELAG